MFTKGERAVEGWINWEAGINIYALGYIKHITNKDPLYTTGNYAQYYMLTLQGKTIWKINLHDIANKLFFSHPVVSDSLWSYGLQNTRPPYPSPSPEVCPSSCPLHQWCHPAISSSDALFSFCLQSIPASGTFPMTQLFISGEQNTGASGSASVLQMRWGIHVSPWLIHINVW